MPELGKATYVLELNTSQVLKINEAKSVITKATDQIDADLQSVSAEAKVTGASVVTLSDESIAAMSKMAAGTKAAATESVSGLGRMRASIKRTSESAMKMAGFAGLGAAYFVVKSGVDTLKDNNAAQLQMAAAIKTTGGVAGVTQKHAMNLAKHWEEVAGSSRAATTGMLGVLLSFTGIRNIVGKGNQVFDRTAQVIENISAKLHRGLQPTAIAVGKALQDPTKYLGALARTGVTFSKQQVDVIKHLQATQGPLAAQKYLLTELEHRYNGAAVAAGKSFAGQLNIAKLKLGEASGQMVTAFIPAFTSAIHILTVMGQVMAQHKGIVKDLVLAFIAWKVALVAVGVATKAATAIQVIWKGVQWLTAKAIRATTIAEGEQAAATRVLGTASVTAGAEVGGLRLALISLGSATVIGALLALTAVVIPLGLHLRDLVNLQNQIDNPPAKVAGAGASGTVVYDPLKHGYYLQNQAGKEGRRITLTKAAKLSGLPKEKVRELAVKAVYENAPVGVPVSGGGPLPGKKPTVDPGAATPYLSYLLAKAQGPKGSIKEADAIQKRIVKVLQERMRHATSLAAKNALQSAINTYSVVAPPVVNDPVATAKAKAKAAAAARRAAAAAARVARKAAQHTKDLATIAQDKMLLAGGKGANPEAVIAREIKTYSTEAASLRKRIKAAEGNAHLQAQLYGQLLTATRKVTSLKASLATHKSADANARLTIALDKALLANDKGAAKRAQSKIIKAEITAYTAEENSLKKRLNAKHLSYVAQAALLDKILKLDTKILALKRKAGIGLSLDQKEMQAMLNNQGTFFAQFASTVFGMTPAGLTLGTPPKTSPSQPAPGSTHTKHLTVNQNNSYAEVPNNIFQTAKDQHRAAIAGMEFGR